jgi:predicted Zn-dependent peptidase
MRSEVHHFDNGLMVATASMPHMASVSVGLWVGVGGRFESAQLNGASHFIEHMLFKGTERRSARQISQAVEGIGGYLNAFTAEENTCFYAKARAEHFEHLVGVLADMFLHSRFEPGEIEKEREVIKEESAMYLDQPQHLVQDLLNEAMWPDHPLGRSLTGTDKSLNALGRKQLLEFRANNYVAPALVIAVAGNIEHRRVLRSLRPLLPAIQGGKRPNFLQARLGQTKPRVRLVTKETSQLQLALGLRVCSRHDDKRFPLRLLNTLLGENASSRLFQVLREDHGIAYSVHSSVSHFDDVGCLSISAGLDPSELSKTLVLIMKELRRFVDEAPTDRELRQARDYLIGQMEIALESTDSQMMWLGEQLLGYGKVIPAEEIKRRVYEVRPSDVRKAAREFIRSDRLTAAVVSPLKSDQGIRKILAGLSN